MTRALTLIDVQHKHAGATGIVPAAASIREALEGMLLRTRRFTDKVVFR
jgi:hypothetical protein